MNYSTPFLNMDASKKREVIEDVLSMNIYGHMAEVAKEKYLAAKGELSKAETRLVGIKETYNVAATSHTNFLKEKERFDSERDRNINTLTQQINNLIAQKNEYESKLDQTDFDSEIKSAKEKREQVRTIITQSKTRLAIVNDNIAVNNEALSGLDQAPHCPKCHVPTENPIIKSYIADLKTKISVLTNEKTELTVKITKAQNVFESFDSKVNNLEQRKDDQKDLKSDIEVAVTSLRSKYESLKIEESRTFNVADIITDIELADLKKTFDESSADVAVLTKSHDYNLILRKILGEDGVRKFVLSKVLPFFNTKVNQYLKIMGSELTIKFDSNLDEQIFTRVREERSYGSFSAGEKKRIDIAILLSLMDLAKLQNSVDTNLLILDEVLDTAMCNDGIENFLNFLKDGFKQMYPDKAVYIITHRNTINSDVYNRMIVLQKKDGFTTIETIVDMQKDN